ncbi:MAG TPA: hypothetical protein ENN29_12820 [Candidatus Hydrogenedentes bacterium]|nr:hypothetical protein [Candidatus Hydrogenedentota bacterium]
MRHSEKSPDGTDLDSAYAIHLNGKPLAYEWRERNVFRHGNAYYGHAVTEPCDFSGGGHEIAITTAAPWCMIRGQFVVINDEEINGND